MAKTAPPKWCAAPIRHAAAGIIRERPPRSAVDVETSAAPIGMIRRPGGRAQPHVPVHARGNRLAAQVARLRKRPDIDVDRLDGAKFAAPTLVDRAPVILQHALAAAGNDTAVTAGRRHHLGTLGERPRLGLLTIDVLAMAAGLNHHQGMPVVGRGAVDGIDISAGQQIAEVGVGLAIAILVAAVDAIAGRVAVVRLDVADGYVLHVAAAQVRSLIAGTLVADADTAHDDAVAGRSAVAGPEGRLRDQVGTGDRGCGRGLEKVSPVGTLFHGSALPFFLKHGRTGPTRAPGAPEGRLNQVGGGLNAAGGPAPEGRRCKGIPVTLQDSCHPWRCQVRRKTGKGLTFHTGCDHLPVLRRDIICRA